MKEIRIAAVALASLLLGACAGAPAASVSSEADTERQASVSRAVLVDSLIAARTYGQAHLGHFLGLNSRRLQREGLEIPPRVSVKVGTTHTAFCITVVNSSLPSIHPWARATISSGEPRPSSEEGCDY